MKKRVTLNTVITIVPFMLFLGALCNTSAYAQLLLEDSFEGVPPEGWKIIRRL